MATRVLATNNQYRASNPEFAPKEDEDDDYLPRQETTAYSPSYKENVRPGENARPETSTGLPRQDDKVFTSPTTPMAEAAGQFPLKKCSTPIPFPKKSESEPRLEDMFDKA